MKRTVLVGVYCIYVVAGFPCHKNPLTERFHTNGYCVQNWVERIRINTAEDNNELCSAQSLTLMYQFRSAWICNVDKAIFG